MVWSVKIKKKKKKKRAQISQENEQFIREGDFKDSYNKASTFHIILIQSIWRLAFLNDVLPVYWRMYLLCVTKTIYRLNVSVNCNPFDKLYKE